LPAEERRTKGWQALLYSTAPEESVGATHAKRFLKLQEGMKTTAKETEKFF